MTHQEHSVRGFWCVCPPQRGRGCKEPGAQAPDGDLSSPVLACPRDGRDECGGVHKGKDGRKIQEGDHCRKFLGGDTPTRKRCCGTVGGRWGWLWCTSTTAWCTLGKLRCTRKFWLGTWADQVGCPTSWSARGRAWSGPCLGPAPPALSIRAPVWVVRRTSLRERKVFGPSRVRAGVQIESNRLYCPGRWSGNAEPPCLAG